MIRSEVALSARRRQPRDRDRRGMARMTRRAGANRAIVVRLADAMALRAPAGGGGGALDRGERMGGSSGAARLVAFGELDLLGLQSFFAEHRRPRGRRVTAAQVLLVDRLRGGAAGVGLAPFGEGGKHENPCP